MSLNLEVKFDQDKEVLVVNLREMLIYIRPLSLRMKS